MATANKENYNLWRHFLSSLKKTKDYFTPEKKKKDVFLGNIDCFSTNLSRQLLGTSGQKIETELAPSSLKQLKTSAVEYDMKHNYVHDVPAKRSKLQCKCVLNKTRNQTASKGLEAEKSDSKFPEEFEERTQKGSSHMDDVSDIVKAESDSISSEVLRKQSTKVIEPDLSENISDIVKVEPDPCEVLRKQTTKLIEQGMREASSVEVQLGFKETATSSSHPDKTCKLKAIGEKQNVEERLYQNAAPVEENKAKVPIILASEAISEINENIETNRVRQRNTNKYKRKVDVDTPCSQWTLEMLSQYVDFKQSVGEIEEENKLGRFQNIVDRIVEQTLSKIEAVQQVIFEHSSGDIYDFSAIRGTEADVRILLDAILIPFAKEMQLKIETEKFYKNKNLPNCTFDYRIHYKNDVVGLVEAKSRLHGSGIGPESVVQGILQLSALQAEVYGRMVRAYPTSQQVDPVSLFNIISDGYQFIFIQLDHDKLLFNHQSDKNIYGEEMPTIRRYVVDSRKGLEEILVKIANQLLEAMNWVHPEKEDENVEMEGEEEEAEYEIDGEGTIILD